MVKKNSSRNLMFLGTGSDVGKSIVATAFCRIFKNEGYAVAPFKAQNMSNNSYVTMEGGEIGRAQATQAEAAGLLPSVHMNPVLLKPTGDMGSQVVVCGQVFKNMTAKDYYTFKDDIKFQVLKSYHSLENQYECIVLEGAGSCCEVNLRKHDIVNFEMALSVKAPVIIVADIDRGGVFAQIIGSMELISKQERNLVAGFIINKFRGDPQLFQDGIAFIEEKTQKPVLGLVPYYKDIHIDREDSMSLDNSQINIFNTPIKIAVIRLSHVSNFTDIEALESEPEVSIHWLVSPNNLLNYDAIIIPGSKNVIYDLKQIEKKGWFEALHDYTQKDRGMIVGLCGGYQMLGKEIHDPKETEGPLKEALGIGLLDISTEMDTIKVVKRSSGKDRLFQTSVRGYEIHMGKTRLNQNASAFIDLQGYSDGAISKNKMVFGSYLHGLFDSGTFRQKFLECIAKKNNIEMNHSIKHSDYWDFKEKNYELLGNHFKKYTQTERIIQILNNGV
ncbi:cobalamin biosynthesis protein CobQ [Candidatus Magnetomorum sp. HK-1]|nr:cobalamin biosynthesis protein CobQ [Candidatus Magnetomorum sp. HK-1]